MFDFTQIICFLLQHLLHGVTELSVIQSRSNRIALFFLCEYNGTNGRNSLVCLRPKAQQML